MFVRVSFLLFFVLFQLFITSSWLFVIGLSSARAVLSLVLSRLDMRSCDGDNPRSSRGVAL